MHTALVALALYAKISLVIDQIGDVVPLEELSVGALPDDDAGEAGADQDLGVPFVPGQEALLTVAVQLLGAHNVINFR